MLDFSRYVPLDAPTVWQPWLAIFWAGSDLAIIIASLAIPLALGIVLKQRPDFTHKGTVMLFAAFVLLCGLTHALSIVAAWFPISPILTAFKFATGAVALLTAAALFRLIPVLVRLPTPDRHDEVIEQIEVALVDLAQTRNQLEARVKQRTGELDVANAQLARTMRETLQRSRDLIHVVASLVEPGKDDSTYPETFLRELRGRINALLVATTIVMEQDDRMGVDLGYIILRQIEPLFPHPSEQLSVAGPKLDIGTQGAQQLSLVTWEPASRFAQLGRPEQARGKVAISWKVEEQTDGEAQFTFEWRESFGVSDTDPLDKAVGGDGTYTPEPLASFSETLLRQIVPRSLNGKGRFDIAPATFIYRLSCPLGELLETAT